MTRDGSPGGGSLDVGHPFPDDLPRVVPAVRFLERYGGQKSSVARTATAVERFFTALERRFKPLLGSQGYRTLIEEAHLLATRDHPLMELWLPRGKGSGFFGDPPLLTGSDASAEFWEGAVAVTGRFLALVETLARRGELNGLEERGVWDLDEREGAAGSSPSRPSHGQKGLRSPVPWRLVVVARDLASCQAIGRLLDEAPDLRVVVYAQTAEEVRSALEGGDMDFVVAAGHLPPEELMEVCRASRVGAFGRWPAVLISGLPEDYGLILRFLEAGAEAVTLEEISVEGLRLNLRLLARGEAILPRKLQHLMIRRLSELADLVRDRGLDPQALVRLAPREMEVLDLLETGLTNRQIALRLHLSEGTVKGYVHQILEKLNVTGREEAANMLRLDRALSRGGSRVD